MDFQREPTVVDVMSSPPELPVSPTVAAELTNDGTHPSAPPQILAELIIEEVSIDGMCGVY